MTEALAWKSLWDHGVTLDTATLFIVTVFLLGLSGLLLLFSWLQNRSTQALAWWGLAFLLSAPGVGLFGLRGTIAEVWSVPLSNTFFLLTYGFLWTGARVFEGRKPLILWAVCGAALWLTACQFSAFIGSLPARIAVVSSFVVIYCLLMIWELWQGRRERLISRWPVMALVALHAVVFLMRIPAIASMSFPVGAQPASSTVSAIMIFGPLFYAYALVFLLMALTKERAEQAQRQAATIDSLTGIANRRGFTERIDRVVARAKQDKMPLTLLLFDLDHFKTINDRFGHRTGDHILVVFSQAIMQSLRPLDLIGRIGGEEFVAVLPGVTSDTALEIAERVRETFAAMACDVDGHATAATVSIGTAYAIQAGYDFDALYAVADAALYRAKQKGRNRTEPGRPTLTVIPLAAES